MEILVRRSSDKIATIRAKALGYVASTVQRVNAASERHGKDKTLVQFIIQSCNSSAGKPSKGTPDPEERRKGSQLGETNRMLEFLKKRVQGRDRHNYLPLSFMFLLYKYILFYVLLFLILCYHRRKERSTKISTARRGGLVSCRCP